MPPLQPAFIIVGSRLQNGEMQKMTLVAAVNWYFQTNFAVDEL